MFVVLDVTFWSFWEDTVIFGGSNEQKKKKKDTLSQHFLIISVKDKGRAYFL